MTSTLRRTQVRLITGDSVGLRLDPEGCHLFPAATAVRAPDGTVSATPALTA